MVDLNKLKEELKEIEEKLSGYLQQLRTGRPNPNTFEQIMVPVEAYKTTMNVKSLGTIAVVEGTSVVISPFDKSVTKDIAKAIIAADLGYNPADEGDKVRINIPPLTEEIRQRTVDQMYVDLEERFRKAVRQVRQEYNQKVDRAENLSEDQQAGLKKQIQKLVDETIANLDQLAEAKAAEIMPASVK